MKQAFFFDMDGTLFDSMPNHARAWDEVAKRHRLQFTPEDCYREEGRTGMDILSELFSRQQQAGIPTELDDLHKAEREQRIRSIYQEKSDLFHRLGDALPIRGAKEVLNFLREHKVELWIVTGSAQQTLFDQLDSAFPDCFTRERMITALDIKKGKPAPDPYLAAWKKSGLRKEDCFVVENAPLGVRSAKAAGLCCYAVNTGPLPDEDLRREGADVVLPDMYTLLSLLKNTIL